MDRIDLADLHGPTAVAAALHRQLGPGEGPVPVVELARALDIEEVRFERLDGCEGVLLTDRVRSRGRILVNNRGGRRRARFGVGHELGHFLLESHLLHGEFGFRCSRADMREPRGAGLAQRQEREANSFAISLLAPRYALEPTLARNPDLHAVTLLRDRLDISLEATLRRVIELHDAPLAAIWSRHGVVQSVARGRRFPWIKLGPNERLPEPTSSHRAARRGERVITEMAETPTLAWTDAECGELFEQARIGANGHAVTLLWRAGGDPEDEESREVANSASRLSGVGRGGARA